MRIGIDTAGFRLEHQTHGMFAVELVTRGRLNPASAFSIELVLVELLFACFRFLVGLLFDFGKGFLAELAFGGSSGHNHTPLSARQFLDFVTRTRTLPCRFCKSGAVSAGVMI